MIKVDHISKRFGSLLAVSDLSFEVAPGDILGFLGPNGAGKSTTMKIICGFLTPDAGSVSICGASITENPIQAKMNIGYLPEGAPTYSDMTVIDFLKFIMQIRQMKAEDKKRRLEYVVEYLQIEEVLYQRVETLSKGFKRRVGLAQALIHDPQVLIMDEPTDGLDPNQKYQVRSLINSLSKDKIVVISTHILEEVTAVCTRAMIVAKGKVLIDSTPSELVQRSRYNNAVSVHSKSKETVEELCEQDIDILSFEYDSHNKSWVMFTKPGQQGEVYERLNHTIKAQSLAVSNLRVEAGRLDEVFREITSGSLS